MKKICGFLAVLMLLPWLHGCSGVQSVTPADDAEVRKVYLEQMLPSSTFSAEDLLLTYYGSFDGTCVFFWEGVRADDPKAGQIPRDYGKVVRYESVAGCEFRYSTLRPLKVYSDGKIYGLTEAYEQGILTRRQISALQRVYEERNPRLYAQELGTDALSEPRVAEITALYTALHGRELEFEYFATAYLGSFGEASVFLQEGAFAATETLTVGAETFSYFMSFSIHVCADEKIYELAEAYDSGIVSDEDLSGIALAFRSLE